ncbi:MAG: hypothetical protein DBY16_09105 [Coprobacter sp.]|nr:MAG: hypothetical protein DBY16_09105 [Coprobacter sp.]
MYIITGKYNTFFEYETIVLKGLLFGNMDLCYKKESMKKIVIIYDGITEELAKMVASQLQVGKESVRPISSLTPVKIKDYDTILLGLSANGNTEEAIKLLSGVDLKDKTVGLFGHCARKAGMEMFCSLTGRFHDFLKNSGAHFIGAMPVEDYKAGAPIVAEGNEYVGLAFDEAIDGKATDSRVQAWTDIMNNNPNSQPLFGSVRKK